MQVQGISQAMRRHLESKKHGELCSAFNRWRTQARRDVRFRAREYRMKARLAFRQQLALLACWRESVVLSLLLEAEQGIGQCIKA